MTRTDKINYEKNHKNIEVTYDENNPKQLFCKEKVFKFYEFKSNFNYFRCDNYRKNKIKCPAVIRNKGLNTEFQKIKDYNETCINDNIDNSNVNTLKSNVELLIAKKLSEDITIKPMKLGQEIITEIEPNKLPIYSYFKKLFSKEKLFQYPSDSNFDFMEISRTADARL
jgi:hypothetical protein